MEVKPGYKQTEVGVIPEEWDVSPLGKCLTGRPSYGINAAAVPYSDNLPVYIRITDISEDGRFSPDRLVSVKSELSGNYYLSDGDIVFARTGASVGKSYRYDANDGPLVFAGFLIRVRPDVEKLLPDFAAAYVTTDNYWRWVRLMSMRSGQPGINGNEYSKLPIPVPPLPEQRAIAEALSDVDGLLGGLDRLIAKKRDLKQAAMQQLLTGQTRLPGFHGEWEVKRLSQHFRIYAGGDVPKHSLSQIQSDAHPYPIFANAIQNKGLYGFTNERRSIADSLTITARGYLGHAEYRDQPFFPIVRLLVLEPIGQLDARFTTYAINDRVEFAIESTGVPQLTAPQVEKYSIVAPPTLAEQTAIAEVLTEMDAELAALEQRREKTRALKQAMMQELLTGRIRLI